MNTHQDIQEVAGQVNDKLTHIVMSLKDMPVSEDESPEERQSAINKVAFREFAYLAELKKAVAEHGKTHSLNSEKKAIELIRICNGHHDYLQQVLRRHRAVSSFMAFVEENNNSAAIDVLIGELGVALKGLRAIAPIFMHQSRHLNAESFVYELITKLNQGELSSLMKDNDTQEKALSLLKPFFIELSGNKGEALKAVERREIPTSLEDFNWGYCRNALYAFHASWIQKAKL